MNMSKSKKVIVFNSIIREFTKMMEPPYYYPTTIEFTEDNLPEIKNEICNQIQDVLKLKNVDILKEFVDNLRGEKKKLEFEHFIMSGHKTNDAIHIIIKTDININRLKEIN